MEYTSYAQYKADMIRKHGKEDWKVETSSMDQYGQYHKTYTFGDGTVMIECNRPVWEEVEVETEVKGIKVTVRESVKLFETEVFSNIDPVSKKFYEKW